MRRNIYSSVAVLTLSLFVSIDVVFSASASASAENVRTLRNGKKITIPDPVSAKPVKPVKQAHTAQPVKQVQAPQPTESGRVLRNRVIPNPGSNSAQPVKPVKQVRTAQPVKQVQVPQPVKPVKQVHTAQPAESGRVLRNRVIPNPSSNSAQTVQSQKIGVQGAPVQTQTVGVQRTPMQTQTGGVQGRSVQTQTVGVQGTPMQTQTGGVQGPSVQTQTVGVQGTPMQTQTGGFQGPSVQTQTVGVQGTPIQTQTGGVQGPSVQTQTVGMQGTPMQTQTVEVQMDTAQAPDSMLTPPPTPTPTPSTDIHQAGGQIPDQPPEFIEVAQGQLQADGVAQAQTPVISEIGIKNRDYYDVPESNLHPTVTFLDETQAAGPTQGAPQEFIQDTQPSSAAPPLPTGRELVVYGSQGMTFAAATSVWGSIWNSLTGAVGSVTGAVKPYVAGGASKLLGAGKTGLGYGWGAGKAVIGGGLGAGKTALGYGLGAGKAVLGGGLGAGKAVVTAAVTGSTPVVVAKVTALSGGTLGAAYLAYRFYPEISAGLSTAAGYTGAGLSTAAYYTGLSTAAYYTGAGLSKAGEWWSPSVKGLELYTLSDGSQFIRTVCDNVMDRQACLEQALRELKELPVNLYFIDEKGKFVNKTEDKDQQAGSVLPQVRYLENEAGFNKGEERSICSIGATDGGELRKIGSDGALVLAGRTYLTGTGTCQDIVNNLTEDALKKSDDKDVFRRNHARIISLPYSGNHGEAEETTDSGAEVAVIIPEAIAADDTTPFYVDIIRSEAFTSDKYKSIDEVGDPIRSARLKIVTGNYIKTIRNHDAFQKGNLRMERTADGQKVIYVEFPDGVVFAKLDFSREDDNGNQVTSSVLVDVVSSQTALKANGEAVLHGLKKLNPAAGG